MEIKPITCGTFRKGWLLGSKFTDGDTVKAPLAVRSILRRGISEELHEDGSCNSILAVGPKIDEDTAYTVRERYPPL